MSAPLQGMVLAAGFGTRLLPATRVLPKALLPVAGEPILQRILRWLAREGVAEVAINAHHLAGDLERWIEAARAAGSGGPGLRLFHETEILGTGGAIANAASVLRADPVVIANSDQIFEVDLSAAAAWHRARGPLATLLLARDPRRAQVRVAGGRVTEIAPAPVYGDPDLWAFTGVYLLAAEGVERLRARATEGTSVRFRDVLPDFREWMREGRLCALEHPAEPFREIGSPEAWLELLRESEADGASWVDPRAEIAPDAVVAESIVLQGARVEAGARVERSILAAGAVARGRVERVIAAAGEIRPLALLSRTEEEELAGFLSRGWPAARRPLRVHLRLLKGDGSTRRFARAAAGDETRVVALPPAAGSGAPSIYPSRPGGPSEAESFRYVSEYLAGIGVRTPRIEAFDLATGRALLEDLGDTHLADVWKEARRSGNPSGLACAGAHYDEAVDLLLRMQGPAASPFTTARTHNLDYDEAFIARYEAGYFLREMARGLCQLEIAPEEEAALAKELRAHARDALEGAPRVFMHRDFQSRNLMVTARGLAVIDVQGARLGPPEYDLASLVEDPYADLPFDRREELIDRYLKGSRSSPVPIAPLESRRRYAACMIHRLLQALGAFAYLGGRLGKPGFLEYAPAALRTLRLRAPLAGTRLGALLESAERILCERA